MNIFYCANTLKRKAIFVILFALFLTACGGSDNKVPLTNKEIALEKISSYAEDGTQAVPILQDYLDAGVTGVTAENLLELNSLVDNLIGDDVDTTLELDALTAQLGINIKPTANAGDDKTVQVNKSITLTGVGTDIDGIVTDYQWSNGSTVLATTASFEYTSSIVGNEILTFTVTDNDGDSATDTVDVVFTAEPVINQLPSANAGTDKTVQVNQSITITGSGSDSDGNITNYEWTKGSVVLASTASFAYTPTTVGIDTLILTVTDNSGATKSDTTVVTVVNVPEVVEVTDTTPPVITIQGDNPVNLTQGEVYVDAGAIASDSKDGSLTVNASGTVDTSTPGIYEITYTVSDSAGNISTQIRSVEVIATLNKISKTYIYDIYGRVIEENLGDGRYIEYTYDDSGNLINQTVIGGE